MGGAIYVDDSGTPGSKSGSDFLSSSRKSWTAVIVPDSVAVQVSTGMDIFLTGVREEFGADELHFMEIYGGRGIWKQVPLEKRIAIFDSMQMIVERFQFPIVHQTVSDWTLKDHPTTMVKKLGEWWNPQDISHFGFLYLCSQVAKHLREHQLDFPDEFPLPMPLYVDEGLAKAGTDIKLPNWSDAIEGPVAHFRTSKDMPGIQIADFAAFTISRTQWIMAQQKLGETPSRGDLLFLQITGGFNVLNLPKTTLARDNISKEAYEFVLSRDRQNKGLTPRPKRSDL